MSAPGVYVERFVQPADPRLGRHVQHDERSRRFAYRGPVSPLRSVRWQRQVPVFDQGATGSCTGNAAVGCLATEPFHATVTDGDVAWLRSLDQAAARECYSLATRLDPFRGEWPPDDTGSDGLSVAKVLHAAGAISGYRHAFGVDQALQALMSGPVITGTVWTSGMYDVGADGIVHPTGVDEGGHEYIADEYDAERGLVGFTNSWSAQWGVEGRFYMPAEEWAGLLARQGDVTVFVASSEAPPSPAPDPAGDADRVLADKLKWWASKTTATQSRRARAAVRDWLTAKGL